MTRKPSQETTSAWARLVRVQQGLLAAVEQDLKTGGFPPLSWYDALLELSRAPNGMLRPVELEKHMLLPQYSTSRLVDRLAEAGLAERKTCPIDERGQYVVITPAAAICKRRCGTPIPRPSNGMSAPSCPTRMRPSSAICWGGWPDRLRSRLPFPRPRD